MTTSKPNVLWAQRPESVYVTIDVKELKEHTVDVTDTELKFKGTTTNGKEYACEFELFGEVKKDDIKVKANRVVEVYIPKKEEESWSNLAKTKQAYIKVDWSKWVDSDDEGENFDTNGMGGMGGMPGMGGMGGMPGMGGMGGMPGMGGVEGMGGMPGMGGMDFSQMMGGMGGMGGAGGMAGMEEMMAGLGGGAGGLPGMGGDDSDDDEEDGDLPDLDEPVADGAAKTEAAADVETTETAVGA